MRRGRLGGRPRAVLAAVTLAGALTAVAAVSGSPAASPAATAAPAAPTPVAGWRLDDGTGSIARDGVGNRPGVLRGGASLGAVAQGPTQTAGAFDGTGFVEVPVDGTSTPVTAASVWVRLAHGSGGGIVLDGTPVSIGVAAGRPVATACRANGCTVARSTTSVRDGAWHELAASVASGQLVLYVDGVVAARTPGAAPVPAWQGGAVIGPGWRGSIDDVVLYAAPLAASDVASSFRADACPQRAATPTGASTRQVLPALPLHTSGRWVVDAAGHRVKLAGVNWYGAEELDRVPAGLQCQSIDTIASRIAADGFNVVRLPWATDTWVGRAPAVPPVAVAANPQLRGRDARQVFDAVVAALARHGLMVILDNHVGRPDWCCGGSDGNALWWEDYQPSHRPAWWRMSPKARTRYFQAGQRRWLQAWTAVAGRYGAHGAHPTPAVVGAELRNELRHDALLHITPVWTKSKAPAWADWAHAAEVGGRAVLRANPRLLVVVDGVHYANDLTGAATRLIRLSRPHRLVYAAHDYPFFHAADVSDSALRARLGQRWGYLLTSGHAWTAPVWVSEWGACHPDGPSCGDAPWLSAFTHYLQAGDLDFAYWSVNGTGARGSEEPSTCGQTLRFPGCPEGYGLSDASWAADASPALSATLHALIPATQR